MNICESLTASARIFPDSTAIVWNGQQLTYGRLNWLSCVAAEQLVEAGIEPGDRVAIMLPNAPSFPIWYYATLRLGAIAVSVSTRLSTEEVNFIVEDCQAKVFVGDQQAADTASDLPESIVQKFVVSNSGDVADRCQVEEVVDRDWYLAEPDDPALILYTSGTTGFPKGATLSHRNVRSNVHAFNHLCGMQHDDVVLLAVPLFHCFGQNALLNSVLNVGGTLIFQQKFDLNESKKLIAEYEVTQLYGVPMMFQLLCEHCSVADLRSVGYSFSAAATLPLQTATAWQQKFGMPIHEGYGLTETSPFASYNHRDRFVPGSIGTPIDNVEMKIVDTESGATCPPGKLGEIVIRGPNVMLGYWNRTEDTAQAIRNDWFYSGDIGSVDSSGYFYIVDRVKDMIAVGGLKVFPAEVERVMRDHPSVAEVAVVGVPDALLGEQVIAYVVADGQPPIDLSKQLLEYAKQHLGNYKIPRKFLLLDELPRNPSGKVLKTRLRELADSEEKQTPGDHHQNLAANSDSNQTTQVASFEVAYSVENGHVSIENQAKVRARSASEGSLDVDLNSSLAGASGSYWEKTATSKVASLAAELKSVHASEYGRTATLFLQRRIQQIVESKNVPDSKSTFIDAGLDSLMIVDLTAQLQVEIGEKLSLPSTLIFDYPRISDLAGFLVELLTQDPNHSQPPTQGKHPSTNALQKEIEDMSEEQALEELLKELS